VQVDLLVCLRCGGPLAKIATVPAIVECEFCDAVISVGQAAPVVTSVSTHDAKREADRQNARQGFMAKLTELIQAGRPPYEALREASAAHLGTAGQTETLARITIALAVDFEGEDGIPLDQMGMMLARIAEGYLRVLGELRTAASYELNLPFLTADHRGPRHLARMLSPAVLAELAQREPGSLGNDAASARRAAAQAAAPPAATPAEEPPKKKKKWFGLF